MEFGRCELTECRRGAEASADLTESMRKNCRLTLGTWAQDQDLRLAWLIGLRPGGIGDLQTVPVGWSPNPQLAEIDIMLHVKKSRI